jgi:NAD(P)-dependent dehydrogenase (short-subunit alcohol dehydrogenase family)
MEGIAAVSIVNAGVEAFARSAALELRGKARVNVVSPGWVAETLKSMGRDPSQGVPAATVAQAYKRSLGGSATGEVISATSP